MRHRKKCRWGHDLIGKNVYIDRGRIGCKECRNAYLRARRRLGPPIVLWKTCESRKCRRRFPTTMTRQIYCSHACNVYEIAKRYRENNLDKLRERRRRWSKRHPEHNAMSSKRWRLAHPGYSAKQSKAWRTRKILEAINGEGRYLRKMQEAGIKKNSIGLVPGLSRMDEAKNLGLANVASTDQAVP